jgi:DNA-binding PadR family transcriptional regulator
MTNRVILTSKMPRTKILEALALAGTPLTKYDLERQKIPSQSIYDWIPKMLKDDLIEEDKSKRKESRAGLPQRYYKLTYRGWIFASGLVSNPKMKIPEPAKGLIIREEQAREHSVEPWIDVIRQVYVSGKAAPGWSLSLTLKADKDGNVKRHISAGF